MSRKISIITVAYNNRLGLEETIKSVTNQTFKDFEFLIIDGNSNDGSKDLLKNYSCQIDYWVSEPDNGIYNAMNKGIHKANGEYLIFMNSGDIFSSKWMLEKCLPYLSGEDFVYGDAYYQSKERRYEYKIPRIISLGTLLKEPICHQSAFIRRAFLLENECYNENYKISSDHIFNLNVFITKKPTQRHIPEYVSVFDKNGISCTQNDKAQEEVRDFLNKNLSLDIQKMALEYDEIKKFYESAWAIPIRKMRNLYFRIRYKK